jgi:hypothetical protein
MASAVLLAAEAVILVTVSMVLVLCGGCTEDRLSWECTQFVVGYAHDC